MKGFLLLILSASFGFAAFGQQDNGLYFKPLHEVPKESDSSNTVVVVNSHTNSSLEDATEIDQDHKNAFFLELGGDAPLYSCNYERFIYIKNSPLNISTCIGLGSGGAGSGAYLPMEVNFLIAKWMDRMEIGLGFTPNLAHNEYNLILGRIGYRIKVENGSFIRFDFTPVHLLNNSNFSFNIWGGISIGFSF